MKGHFVKLGFALVALIFASPAFAQPVQQTGSVTRNHIPYWAGNGLIGDAGTSADSPISSIGVTNESGAGFCVASQRQSAAGRNLLCFSTATAGTATISLQNYGTAAAQALQFVINGTTYPFPGSLANITIGTTAVVGGTTGQCLYVTAGVVGQQACTLSAITSLTGDVTATGPGVSAATLASVNSNVGTFGSGALIPIITVNGKGLITAVTTSALALTVGSTTITSGSTNGILYNNGAVLGNLGTLASAVLTTSAGGVPSMATTLPSGLTIPSPTFTGTETFPDAATWTASGISKVAALSVGSATLPSAGNVSVSGQYQVNGTQVAAANLLDGKTGIGALVGAAGPAISGTWTGSPTFSGNITFSGQLIETGTSAPASAGGNTVVMGTIASPTLTNTGQAFLYNTVVNGAILEGDGSTNDVSIFNKSGVLVAGVPTGTTKLNFPSLSSGTCSAGLGLDSGNNTILISCPGAASSIQVGTTTVTSSTASNYILTTSAVSAGTGTLANVTQASLLTAGTGIAVTGTTNATIALTAARQTNPTTQALLSGSGTYSTPANVLWIKGKVVGGGGGGAPSNTSSVVAGNGGNSCWNTTGAACTTPVYQAGGGVGGTQGANGGNGGTVSGTGTCFIAVAGGQGAGTGAVAGGIGGSGGASSLGGAGGGAFGANGGSGANNTGGGGGGAGNTAANDGAGGGAGATCEFIINAPAGTYTYAIGISGTAGTGTGFNGGAGGTGGIWIEEHYN